MPYFIGTSIVINDNAAYVHESFTGTGSTTGIGSTFTQIVPSDGAISSDYGYSVAVGSQKIVVGAQNDDDNGNISGAAYIYDLDGSNEIKITASDGAANDRFGWSVSVGSGRIVVGAYGGDSAYVFDLDGIQLVKIDNPEVVLQFGYSCSIADGKIVIGDYTTDNGSAYIFDYDEDSNSYWESIIDTYKY